MLSVVLFYAMARTRYPFVPIVMLFAAAAVADLAAVRVGGVRSRLVGAGLAVAVALPCNWLVPNPDDVTYANLGVELMARRPSGGGRAVAGKGGACRTTYAPAHFSLGLALERVGDKARARDEYRSGGGVAPEVLRGSAIARSARCSTPVSRAKR